MMNDPSTQITINGHLKLPHCTLRLATVSGARNSNTQIPKFDGFQRCRPFTRSTYFDMIESTLARAYGQNAGERKSMPTLMPLIYALERLSHLLKKIRPRTSSVTRAATMARAVLS